MSYKPEKYFKDAVNSGDIQEIKIAMCLYIDRDPADYNGDIKNAINYLDSKGIDIWEEHKEIEPLRSKDQWDRDYIGLLQSDLMHNFSRERLKTILEVGKYVYQISPIVENNTVSYKNSISTEKESNKKYEVDKERKKSQKNGKIKGYHKSSQENVKIINNSTNFENDYDAYYNKTSSNMKAEQEKQREASSKKESKNPNISIIPQENNDIFSVNIFKKFKCDMKYGLKILFKRK